MPALPGFIVQNDSSPSTRSVISAACTFLAKPDRFQFTHLIAFSPRGIVLATVILAKDPLARARILTFARAVES
jgi:hypothetical protein